jgi:pimeloyl-ACP methyl ester carboxylesterase
MLQATYANCRAIPRRSFGSKTEVRDQSMSLADGRTIAFTDLGAAAGPVVMYFHGAPSSRLDLQLHDGTFAALGVRVVSPDRPGYGGSSAHTGRQREDWASDVAALADYLGVDRFAVMGVSTGGPYAVACAALLPDRVASAATVCGVTDCGWARAWHGLASNEAALMRIRDVDEAVAWCEARYGRDGSRFLDGELGDLAPADQRALKDGVLAAALVTSVREAFRQGVTGYAQDITVQGTPWTFDPSAIAAPVRVLHGEADTVIPVAHARHTAELIPGAQLSLWPVHGHISILTEIPRLAADLVAPLRAKEALS